MRGLKLCQYWQITNKGDQDLRALADRHYTRDPKMIGNAQFCRPGKTLCLIGRDNKAGFVFWYGKYRRDGFEGVWENTFFRNESEHLSSELITAALAIFETCRWPQNADIITYVNPSKIKSSNPGFCYKKAGFEQCKQTQTHIVLKYEMRFEP